jgi:hypothetical protein
VPDRQDTHVRPARPDIAAPDFPPGIGWIGEAPPPMTALTARGPALVHFLEFAQLNSVRALAYPCRWHARYADHGLSVIGVQTPRFPFGADPAAVSAGLRRLGVSHPVAVDAEREMWLDYGCEGWPSLFLWGRGGVLRWYHFGEGEYLATEEAIQEELRETDALRELPAPLEPLRATDAPGAAVMPPSAELFPAGAGRPLRVAAQSESLEVGYEAGGAYATIEGQGSIRVAPDHKPAKQIRVEGAGLYELATHPRHGAHRLTLEFSAGEMSIWSISFAPGVP